MNQRIKRGLWAGGVLLLVAGLALVAFLAWPKQSFRLPNGRKVTVEAVTWRPDNRMPRHGAAALIELIGRAASAMGFSSFAPTYFDAGPQMAGAVWISADHPADLGTLELRPVMGGVEGQALGTFNPTAPGSTAAHVSAFLLPHVPQNGRPFDLRIYHRGTAKLPPQLLGTVSIEPKVSQGSRPAPPISAALDASHGLQVIVEDWQVPAVPPPDGVLDSSLLQLKILDATRSGIVSSNWNLASLYMWNRSGDGFHQHVDNRGWTNGLLPVGLRPVWLDDSPWTLRLGLVRVRNFPASNQVRIGPLYPNTAGQPNSGVFTNTLNRLFTARLDLGWHDDPTPAVTNWQASLRVTASGGYQERPHQIRYIGLVDQRGTNHGFQSAAWSDTVFRFHLKNEADFLDGTVTSAEALLSWEPIHFVEIEATPRAATNFSDWPKRSAAKPVETNSVPR